MNQSQRNFGRTVSEGYFAVVNERIEVAVPDLVLILAAVVVIWGVSALGAAICAPKGRGVQFAVVTLLFLGPLGVGFAAAAARPREWKAQHGRHTVRCPRCDARQHVLDDDNSFQCWQCHNRYLLEKGPFGRRIEVGRISSGRWPPPQPEPAPHWRSELAETSWRGSGEWLDAESGNDQTHDVPIWARGG